MNLWQFLDNRWPSERAWVTIGLVALVWGLLQMAADNPGLWDVELFKTLLTASVVTGALNMVLAFHFTANKSDETKADNTGKAFDAITATAQASGGDVAAQAAGQVADAAVDEAEAIKEQGK